MPSAESSRSAENSNARHFVYIVRCADGSLYTGYTTDPERRVAEHNRGRGARYTRQRRPVELVFMEEERTMAEAFKRERSIKGMDKNGKLLLILRYQGEEKLSSR